MASFTVGEGLFLANVKALVAKCATYQALFTPANEATALLNIQEVEYSFSASPRPQSYVWFAGDMTHSGPGGIFRPNMQVSVEWFLELNSTGSNDQDKAKNFVNTFAQIGSEMKTLTGSNGNIVINSFSFGIPPTRITGEEFEDEDDTTAEDYYIASYILQCGNE